MNLLHDQKLTPCLWFDDQALPAAEFYTSVFPDSRILLVSHYPSVGQEVHGQAEGRVMTVEFLLAGHSFTALNGGPQFKFSEAVSFQVNCEDQAEIDRYWNALIAGGGAPSQCGWLRDRFGLSWQIVPNAMRDYMTGDPARLARAFAAMMKMGKFDLAALRAAADGRG